jgi:vitamin B12 transporter
MKSIKTTVSGLTVLVAFLWICSPALAQQKSTTADTTVYELDEIIISASKYEQSPQSVGRNVTVISEEEIRKSSYTSVSDLLAEQQSVHMIGSGQTPGSLQQGFIRNANSNHSVVMIDGIRISDPSTNNNAIDLSELSLGGIQRIEIVRGSHSTLYGSSAIGGVVNIITQKDASDGFNANLETQHGHFGTGTYSTTNTLYTNYTSENGLYANVGVNHQFANGLDATIDTVSNSNFYNPQDQDDFRKLDLLGKIGYKNNQYDLYASYRHEGQKADNDQGAYQDDSNAFTEFERDLFSYGVGIDLSSNTTLEVNGAYSELQRDFVNDSSLVSPDGTYDGTYVETNAEGTLLENELKAVTQGEYVHFVAGTSASRQTMSTRNYIYSRSQFGVFESTTDLDSLNLKETIYNSYVHTNLNGGLIADNLEPVSLVFGARYVNHDEFGSHFTYEINPQVQLSSSSLVYGAITTGFNAPSLYQLYSPSMGGSGFTNRGNEDLDPEKSTSYELGWKQQINSQISFELSAFKTKVQNVIEYVYLWDGDTSTENLSASFPNSDYLGDTYINVSEQEIMGLETSASAYLTPKLNLQGNISLTRSTLTFSSGDIDESYTDGNHVQIYESGQFVTGVEEIEGLTRRPSINAFVSATYQAADNLRLKVDSRFVGSRDDVFYSANLGPLGGLDRSEVPNYNVTNMSIRHILSENIAITGKVENLFNTDYQEIKGYRTRGRSLFLKASVSL